MLPDHLYYVTLLFQSTRNFMAINISKAHQTHARKAPAEKQRDELKKKEEERQLNYKKGVVPH